MKKIFALCAMCALLLPGCASNTGQNYVAFYPECRQPILEMEGQTSTAMEAAKGAVGGGVAGGAVGFLLGLLLDGGNVAQAGIGAAVGAASGAITGGVARGMNGGTSEEEENRLLARYYSQIKGRNVSGLNVRQAAGVVAFQCYQRKKKELNEAVKQGTIDAVSAAQRDEAINEGMHAAMALIGPGDTPLSQ